MKNYTVARRYAKALYELATESKTMDDVLQGLNNLTHALNKVPELSKVLFSPVIKLEEKEKLVKTVTSNKLILKFTSLLALRKRLDLIPLIYEQLQSMSDVDKGINRVLVKTAVSLTDPQKRLIEKDLTHSLGGKIIGRFEIAKDLIGGVWIKMGDKVLDATLKRRIQDLRHTLIHSTN